MKLCVIGVRDRFLSLLLLCTTMLLLSGLMSGCAVAAPEDESRAAGNELRKDDPAAWKESEDFVSSVKKQGDGTLTRPNGKLEKTDPFEKDVELVRGSENQSQLRPTRVSCGGDVLGCQVCCGDVICCGGCDSGGPRVCCGQESDSRCHIHW